MNVQPVIWLVYMKKQTKTRKRRYNEKVTKQLMKLEMKLYLVISLVKLKIDCLLNNIRKTRIAFMNKASY